MVRQMKTSRLIGIAGVCPGTGATHLAFMTANCLASWMQRRTAVIEWNAHGDLAAVEAMLTADRGGSRRKAGYSLLEVDYYREGEPGILADCMGAYDDIVIDFGVWRREIRKEWLLCGVKIVTASLSEWKLGAFLECLDKEIKAPEGWIYGAAFGSEDTRRRIERQFGISLKRIPLSVDAFSVDHRVKDWLAGILK